MTKNIILSYLSFFCFIFNIFAIPPKLLPLIDRVNLPMNTTLPLICNLISDVDASFEWSHNGYKLSNSSDFAIDNTLKFSLLTIKNANRQHVGTIECRVSNSLGEFDTTQTQINVQGINTLFKLKSISVCGAIYAFRYFFKSI